MTDSLLPPDALDLLDPATITPGLLALVCDDAPSRMILGAGAGCFTETKITETAGVALQGDALSVEGVMAAMAQIRDPKGQAEMQDAFAQTRKYARMAAEARSLPLPWND
jgi:hypothetical protein